MLNLFRQNTFLAGSLVVVLAFVLRIPQFLSPHAYEFIKGAPFSTVLFDFFETLPDSRFWATVAAATFVAGEAVLINYIVARHNILYKDTFLPGLMYVLVNSFFPQQSELTPQLVSNLFILLLFLRLCYLYESQNPLLLVLDAGIYLGVAILFNYDVSIFLPFILISVVVFTSFNLRYLVISILGIMVPLYLTACVFYLTNHMNELIEYVARSFDKTTLRPVISRYEYLAPLAVLLPVVLVAVFNLQQNFFRNKVKTRRIIQSIGLMSLFGFFGLFIENTNFIYALYYLNIPLCIVLAYYFISDKRFLIKETLFLLLIMFSFYFQLM